MFDVFITNNGLSRRINGSLTKSRINGSITQGVGEIDSFAFSIYPNNEGYNDIQSRQTLITAVNETTNRVEFDGRILLAVEKMDASGILYKEVTAESCLGYLQDSIQPYTAEANYLLNDFIDLVLTNHNAQVEEYKRIYRGNVDVVTNSEGTVYKNLNYQTTFNILKEKLVNEFGGELSIRRVSGVLYLDYLKEGGTTRATKIKLGRNLQSLTREINPLSVITRVIPLGAKIKVTETDDEGNTTEKETEERLTIKGYSGRTVDYIDDEEKQKAYGVVCGIIEFPDVTEQGNLVRKANEWLANNNLILKKHTLTALDLKEIGQDIDGFYCGDSYRVENPLMNVSETMRIIKKTIDINAAYKSSITIGDKSVTLTQITNQNNNRFDIEIGGVREEITDIYDRVEFIQSVTETTSTELWKDAEKLVAEATKDVVTETNLATYKQELEAKVTTAATDVKTEFTNAMTTLEKNIDGTISSKFKELYAYIREYMDANGLPVIELGSEQSNLIAKITNEKIAFLQNGIEVAYISDDKLFITEAEILTSIIIGNFAFVPRANGNLSFVKVR